MPTKSPNHPSMRTHASSSEKNAEQAIRPAMKKFIDELVKSGSATVLTKEESEAILANTELSGCIAHPKSPKKA